MADGSGHGYREKSHNASAQIFFFSLLAEQTKLFFLLLVQRVTVLSLKQQKQIYLNIQ